MERLIVLIYGVWSLLWFGLIVLEWLRAGRPQRLLLLFVSWFAGGVVLLAARMIFT